MKTTLAFLCLAAGIAGLAIGVSGDAHYFMPGAILVGAAVIALPDRPPGTDDRRPDSKSASNVP